MNGAFHQVFNGRRVFVTGHTGFKGSWLALWLHHLGADVTGYALAPPTDPNNFTQSDIRPLLVAHHEADIRDRARLRAALEEARPDIVFHLAAQSIVRRAYEEPLETFDVNVMGTATLLDCIRSLQRPCTVVAVTSDKCYQNREQVWGYRESDAFGDHDPYGGSKGAAEIAIRAYRESFFPPASADRHGVKLASVRAGNVIGGGDWTPHALIVDVVRALTSGEPVRLRNPGAYRPWQHVLQALSGYLTLGAQMLEHDRPALYAGWNIGPLPGNELPVHRVVERFLDLWGEGRWEAAGNEADPHEATILRLGIDKALWELHWRPLWDINETLRHTARWYRQFADGSNSMRELSLDQIQAYEAALVSDTPEPGGGRSVVAVEPPAPLLAAGAVW